MSNDVLRTDATRSAFAGALSLLALIHCGSDDESRGAAPVAAAPSASPSEVTPPSPAPGVCPEGLPISILHGKVIAEIVVGPAKLRAVFDTGATQSIFSSKVPGLVRNAPFSFGFVGRSVSVKSAAVSDAMIKTLRISGVEAVIGLDAVEGKVVTIDYVRQHLAVDDAADDRALAACTRVEPNAKWVDTKRNEHVFVRGTVDELDGWLLLDSGASLGVLTKSAFDTLAKTSARPSLGGFYTPAALGTFWARMTIIDTMNVGGSRVEHMLARTIDDRLLDVFAPTDAPFLGVVPSDFFAHAMVTYDLAANRVRFAREIGADPRLPSRMFPTGIELEESTDLPVRVSGVLKGSAAAEAGIVPGDEIVSIFGESVDAIEPYERAFGLAPSSAGAIVPVGVRHGAVVTNYSLEGRDLL